MPDADDVVELRALQVRAYGRAGALSESEAARLQELEHARAGESGSPSAVEAPDAPQVPQHPADLPAAQPAAADSQVAESGDAPPPHRESALTTLRRHWRLVSVIVVAFVLIGLALGWSLFGDRGAAPMQLSAEQRGWHDAILASGDFDPGSLRAIDEEEGVVIWFATKKDGADVCLVLGDGDQTAPACTTREQALIQGVSATLVKVVDDTQNYDVDAQMFLTADGEPAVIARSYITVPQSTTMFASPEEASTAASLATETGWDRRSIMVAGYDDGVPIWVGVDKEDQRYCLAYDGSMPDPPMSCDDSLMLTDADRTLTLDISKDGESTRYEYRFGYGQQYLTVTKGLGGEDASGD
ncbi:hypothetical protein [Microbacterium phyllosphaerae]|uniref:hypothetical protein n=1 Tax=Microbacterium phyllosphaerae TaxID=124798 RepID=UPI0021680A2D|nr:hypothetical protein [Microbacterium phyllosphaerae]MCS3442106.1 hypothetical protein [Microbacterium phyllosphaerae]